MDYLLAIQLSYLIDFKASALSETRSRPKAFTCLYANHKFSLWFLGNWNNQTTTDVSSKKTLIHNRYYTLVFFRVRYCISAIGVGSNVYEPIHLTLVKLFGRNRENVKRTLFSDYSQLHEELCHRQDLPERSCCA
jgi:hypothetical protein